MTAQLLRFMCVQCITYHSMNRSSHHCTPTGYASVSPPGIRYCLCFIRKNHNGMDPIIISLSLQQPLLPPSQFLTSSPRKNIPLSNYPTHQKYPYSHPPKILRILNESQCFDFGISRHFILYECLTSTKCFSKLCQPRQDSPWLLQFLNVMPAAIGIYCRIFHKGGRS